MVLATMLPAALPAIQSGGARQVAEDPDPALGPAILLATFLAAWTVLGLAIDATMVVGRTVAARRPAARSRSRPPPYSPLRVGTSSARRSGGPSTPTRHPARRLVHPGTRSGSQNASPAPWAGVLRVGLRHAGDSIACSWALMLPMVVAGAVDPWWMAGLTGIMAYETAGRHGRRASRVAGRLLLGLAGIVLLAGWLPSFGPS